MSGLPEEIIENILSRLPVKSISRFRCVCKYWCNQLFTNPRFIKLHLKHATQMNMFNLLVTNTIARSFTCLYSIDHNVLSSSPSLSMTPFFKSEIHGSCNGLVCIEDADKVFSIWNPCTREFRQVPETPIVCPPGGRGRSFYISSYGFGFECMIDDYKLIRLASFGRGHVSEASVYTLGTNSWKSLGFIPYYFCYRCPGLLVDGVLHWIASRLIGSVTRRVIVSFDICDETFRDKPLPDDFVNKSNLGIWEGKLCLLLQHGKDGDSVWMMKDKTTWTRHLNIPRQIGGITYGKLIQIFPNGEVLLDQTSSRKEDKDNLILYDPKLSRVRVLNMRGFPTFCKVDIYIETLVSLNSGTFVGPEPTEEECINKLKVPFGFL